jgi:hypothetical protein
MLWDIFHPTAYDDLRPPLDSTDPTAHARDWARRAEDATDRLEGRVDALVLTSMAMWTLLSEKFGVTEEQLLERIRELDLRDGKLDGRIAPGVQKCASCGRENSQRSRRCLYCGGHALNPGPFTGSV